MAGLGVVECAGLAVSGVAIAHALVSSNVEEKDYHFTGQKYDPVYNYYKFPSDYTPVIDTLLANPKYGEMGNKVVVGINKYIPDVGYHILYTNGISGFFSEPFTFSKITFKKVKTNNKTPEYVYYCKVNPSGWGDEAMKFVEKHVFYEDEKIIRCVSIDTSDTQPKLFESKQMYVPPAKNQNYLDALRIGQQKIIKYIFRHFMELPKNIPNNIINPIDYPDIKEIKERTNIKLLISGKRGIGKTYIGYAIKKILDNYFDCHSKLYDDFNPKSIGVNIETMALRYASRQSPVIIIINEFDIIMDYALDINKQMFDPRLCHARDKSELNNMLDKISKTPYVILVCTTEKSIDSLTVGDKRSFLRYGRFDFYSFIDTKGAIIMTALDDNLDDKLDNKPDNKLVLNPNIPNPLNIIIN